MKKYICFLLTIIMALCLFGCAKGETTMSKDEMLAIATEFELDDIMSAMDENIGRAKSDYIDNVYLITDCITDITEDAVYVSGVKINLPEEDILKLSVGQMITVVGKIDSLSVEYSSLNVKSYHINMTNEYLVSDTVEISGMLRFYYSSYLTSSGFLRYRNGEEDEWEIGLDVIYDNVIDYQYSMAKDIEVTHIPGKAIESVTISGTELYNEQIITVSAKCFKYKTDVLGSPIEYELRDVELVSVDS